MLELIYAQAKIFVGILGSVIAAFIGIMARHVYHKDGYSWRRVASETPMALFAGIFAGGLGQVIGFSDLAVIALASTFAYLTPHVVFPLLISAFKKKHGIDHEEQDGR